MRNLGRAVNFATAVLSPPFLEDNSQDASATWRKVSNP